MEERAPKSTAIMYGGPHDGEAWDLFTEPTPAVLVLPPPAQRLPGSRETRYVRSGVVGDRFLRYEFAGWVEQPSSVAP